MKKVYKTTLVQRERKRKSNEDWKLRHPKRYKKFLSDASRKCVYGVTKEQFETAVKKQNNSCSICKIAFKSLKRKGPNVDHDKKCCPGKKSCGKCVRGFICFNCN